MTKRLNWTELILTGRLNCISSSFQNSSWQKLWSRVLPIAGTFTWVYLHQIEHYLLELPPRSSSTHYSLIKEKCSPITWLKRGEWNYCDQKTIYRMRKKKLQILYLLSLVCRIYIYIKLNNKRDYPVQKWAKDFSRHIYKEDIQIANKNVKRYSISLVTRECKTSHNELLFHTH